jgi:uncharacterized protein YndB with AHSA1/START domain
VATGSTYTVERSTTVHAAPETLFRQVADFRRWPAWSPWEDLDPDIRRSYAGAETGVGSVYEWTGNRKAGRGRMEITRTDEPTRVVVDLRFLKPFKSTSVTTFTFAPEADGTRVTWTMAGPRTLALRVMGLFTSMDTLVGGDFEKGLSRLKTVSEAVER